MKNRDSHFFESRFSCKTTFFSHFEHIVRLSVSLSNFWEIPLTQFVHIHNYQTGFRFRQQNNSNVCMKITISIFKINRFMPDFWYLSSVSLKILSYFYKPKNMAILGYLWKFWDKKRAETT